MKCFHPHPRGAGKSLRGTGHHPEARSLGEHLPRSHTSQNRAQGSELSHLLCSHAIWGSIQLMSYERQLGSWEAVLMEEELLLVEEAERTEQREEREGLAGREAQQPRRRQPGELQELEAGE